MPKTKKRGPQDSTTRNVRAANKKIARLDARLTVLEHALMHAANGAEDFREFVNIFLEEVKRP